MWVSNQHKTAISWRSEQT